MSLAQIYIEIIERKLWIWQIDLKELGNNSIRGSRAETSYRDLRPYNCNCAGLLTPEEEMEWHVHHIRMCFNFASRDDMDSFFEKISAFIEKKSKQFKEEKKEPAVKRIKAKDTTGTCFDYVKHAIPIYTCTNSKQLAEKEVEITKEIEKISGQAQVDDEVKRKKQEENERLRKELEKKMKRSWKN